VTSLSHAKRLRAAVRGLDLAGYQANRLVRSSASANSSSALLLQTKRARVMESLTPPRDSNGRSSRPEFVEFRNRIQRLVESLVGLRDVASDTKSWREQERVEVKLESAAVIVKFFVAEFSWETASELAHHFQSSFGKLDPVFLDAPTGKTIKLARSGEKRAATGSCTDKKTRSSRLSGILSMPGTPSRSRRT